MYFHYFVIISPWKRVWPFIQRNMNPYHPRMLCAKFGKNWPSGSGEEYFYKLVNVISLFRNYLLLEKGMALHLNKLESSSPKDALCQVWLKLALWFLRRRFLKLVNVFSLFPYYLPLEMGVAFHLNKLESPLPKDALCQVSEKFTDRRTDRRTERQTDNGRQAIRKAHLSFQLRWANKSSKHFYVKFVSAKAWAYTSINPEKDSLILIIPMCHTFKNYVTFKSP